MRSISAVNTQESALRIELSMPTTEPDMPERSSLIPPSEQDWPCMEEDVAGPTGLVWPYLLAV